MSYAYNYLTPGVMGAAAIALPVVGIAMVVLRFYSRRSRKLKPMIEDWLVIPALLCTIAMGVLIMYGVVEKAEGYLSNGKQADPKNITVHMIYWNVQWLQCLALGCTKLSFLFFYRTVFAVDRSHSKLFRAAVYVMIGICIVWMIGFFLGAMLECPGNVASYWLGRGTKTNCWNSKPYLFALSWSDFGTDVIIILLPIPKVLQLHMTLRKKLAIIFIFLLGALNVALSVSRAVLYVGLLNNEGGGTTGQLAVFEDPLMQSANGVYWIMIEAGLALFAVNLPIVYSMTQSKGLQTVVEYVRSAISLQSWRSSQRSRGSGRSGSKPKSADGKAVPDHDVEMRAGLVGPAAESRISNANTEETEIQEVPAGMKA